MTPGAGFKPGLWQRDVNVRWFLQQNYTPYDGDAAFLAPATERTRRIWKKLGFFAYPREKVHSRILVEMPGGLLQLRRLE